MERWVKTNHAYTGKIISLRLGDVECEDGTVAFREVVEHPGGVGIVPVLGDSVVLIRQYRIAVGKDILEIPAGKLEGSEDLITRAHLELEEETGYLAGRLVPMGSVYSSVGYTSEEIFLFLAFDLQFVGQRLEFDECIETVTLGFEELRQKIRAHEIKDAKTIIALHFLFDYLEASS